MYNILVSAYAVSSDYGSEPGLGWNWIINLAKHCKLFVITEGEWKNGIEKCLKNLPQADNITFYYNSLPEEAREMSRNQGDWRFYYYYNKWQKKTLKIAEKIISENHIDIIHQLNMTGYREPGYLWKIKDIPYVWGPVGGVPQFPVKYLKGAGVKENFTKRVKNIINALQLKYSPRVQKAIERSDALVAGTGEAQEWLQRVSKKEVSVLNEQGCYVRENISCKTHSKREVFKITWAGRFYFRKQLNLALKTIAKLKHLSNIELHILGSGSEKINNYYKNMAKKLKINDRCIWYGNVEMSKVHEIMSDADIFLFTSVMDATSAVIMEAIQNDLPIVCHNTCGFGPIIDETVGRKIKITNPEQSVVEFSEIINYFYNHCDELEELSRNCDKKQKELSWDNKIKQMVNIYDDVYNKYDKLRRVDDK